MKKFLFPALLFISSYCIGQQSTAVAKYTGTVHPRVVATLNLVPGNLNASEITIRHVDGVFLYDAERSTEDKQVFVKYKDGNIIPYTYFELLHQKNKTPKRSIKCVLRDRGTKLRFRFEK